jgi:type II secretory pathway pseudopilin PulG
VKRQDSNRWYWRNYPAAILCSFFNRLLDFRHKPSTTEGSQMKTHKYLTVRGFTLVELLVVILIVITLAALSLVGVRKFIESGRKVQAMAQFKDFQIGMALFENDFTKPPIPKSKRDTGWDTIYGDPGGNYSTQLLVSALAGEDKDYPYGGKNFSAKDANPRGESHMIFKAATEDNRGRVGKDGRLHDPWGGEVMVAINGFKSTNPDDTLVSFNNGKNDERLHTWGLAEYSDTKPKEQSYVFWSYGKDRKKVKNGPGYGAVAPLAGSDDVISWYRQVWANESRMP